MVMSQKFVANVANQRHIIKGRGEWLVLKPCTLIVDPNYHPEINDVMVVILSDDVNLYGTWDQLNHIEIDYGTYRPPAFVLQEPRV